MTKKIDPNVEIQEDLVKDTMPKVEHLEELDDEFLIDQQSKTTVDQEANLQSNEPDEVQNSDQMNKLLAKDLDSVRSNNEQYHKNVLYVTEAQQEKIKNTKVLFAGVGLGSVIAEAALRIGFEKFVLIDGDEVEPSNLNRQNYSTHNVGISKVEAIRQRLKSINPQAEVESHHLFLKSNNITRYIEDCDIAINAIDFDNAQNSLNFDKACQSKNIPIIHPFNFGWAGAAYVVTSETELIPIKSDKGQRYELTLIKEFIEKHRDRKDLNIDWFEDFLESYTKYSNIISPPQLAVGSYLAAAIVTDILFSLVNGLEVKTFPTPYFLTAR